MTVVSRVSRLFILPLLSLSLVATAIIPGFTDTKTGSVLVKGGNKQSIQDYKNLNPAERSVVLRNSIPTALVFDLLDEASKATVKRYGADVDDTPGNAFKHCYWMGITTRMTSRKFAKELGDAHEEYVRGLDGNWKLQGPTPQKAMDLHNNEFGRAMGYYVAEKNGPFAEIAIICRNLERQGTLQVIKP